MGKETTLTTKELTKLGQKLLAQRAAKAKRQAAYREEQRAAGRVQVTVWTRDELKTQGYAPVALWVPKADTQYLNDRAPLQAARDATGKVVLQWTEPSAKKSNLR